MNRSEQAILNEMITPAATVPLIEKDGRFQVRLSETQYPSSSVTICGVPHNAIVINADCFTSPNSIFAGTKGECKRSDFVIVADTGKRKVIVCIELKAKSGVEKDIIQQLTGTQCFIAYCQKVGQLFWEQNNFLNGYDYRFISISHTSIWKRKTRYEKTKGIHDKPRKMMKISSSHSLQFNQLVGG